MSTICQAWTAPVGCGELLINGGGSDYMNFLATKDRHKSASAQVSAWSDGWHAPEVYFSTTYGFVEVYRLCLVLHNKQLQHLLA
jgi:hypothetical protein